MTWWIDKYKLTMTEANRQNKCFSWIENSRSTVVAVTKTTVITSLIADQIVENTNNIQGIAEQNVTIERQMCLIILTLVTC